VEGENRMTALTEADYDALRENIEEFGLQRPLIVKPVDSAGLHKVVDGHHRLKIARGLGMDVVPCTVLGLEMYTEDEFAIRCAVGNGRQLTQAHKALLAFEQHRTEIILACDENKGGQPFQKVRGSLPVHGAPVDEPFSVTSLENRRGLRHGDLGTLNKAWAKFCPDGTTTEDWATLRNLVSRGSGVGAAVAGIGGKKATDGKQRQDPKPDLLVLEAAKVLARRMANLAELDWKNYEDQEPGAINKAEFYQHLQVIFARFPEEARGMARNWILHNWPEEESDALGKRLTARVKEGK
jgi:hypothetical protein